MGPTDNEEHPELPYNAVYYDVDGTKNQELKDAFTALTHEEIQALPAGSRVWLEYNDLAGDALGYELITATRVRGNGGSVTIVEYKSRRVMEGAVTAIAGVRSSSKLFRADEDTLRDAIARIPEAQRREWAN